MNNKLHDRDHRYFCRFRGSCRRLVRLLKVLLEPYNYDTSNFNVKPLRTSLKNVNNNKRSSPYTTNAGLVAGAPTVAARFDQFSHDECSKIIATCQNSPGIPAIVQLYLTFLSLWFPRYTAIREHFCFGLLSVFVFF